LRREGDILGEARGLPWLLLAGTGELVLVGVVLRKTRF